MKLNLNFIKNRKAVGILCIAVSLIFGFVIFPLASRAAGGTVPVVRASTEIPAGTRITAGMLETVNMGKQNLPSQVETDMADVIGKYAAVDISQEDIITQAKTQMIGSMFNLKDGEMLMSVAIRSLADSVSGKLQGGDVVSVFVPQSNSGTGTSSGITEAQYPPELEFVQVASVTASNGKDTDMNQVQTASGSTDTNLPAAVTLVVTEKQAKILAGLENSALHFALVCRGNDEKAQTLLNRQSKYLLINNSSDDSTESSHAASSQTVSVKLN